jgi:hypothetical protein
MQNRDGAMQAALGDQVEIGWSAADCQPVAND